MARESTSSRGDGLGDTCSSRNGVSDKGGLLYHEGESVRIDNDNMVKPIQDALIGLIYPDDRWITDTIVRKTSIDGFFQFVVAHWF